MKTKEIDVWVGEDLLISTIKGTTIRSEIRNYKNSDDYTPIKAKLLIEIPEKKITISESEFDEWYDRRVGFHEDYLAQDKKELGF